MALLTAREGKQWGEALATSLTHKPSGGGVGESSVFITAEDKGIEKSLGEERERAKKGEYHRSKGLKVKYRCSSG